MRRIVNVALALLAFELLWVIVSGAPVGRASFVLRLLLLGGLMLARFGGPQLVLWLLLLPTLFQFHFAGGRLGGDGVMYYVYTRSLVKDADLDFANEYAHYGLANRGDLQMPTATGLRRSIFAIGPGLLALPGFAVGELVARGQALMGHPHDLSGYGPAHRNGVALSSLLYGFAALLLIHDLLRRHFREGTALFATLLLWGTSFLHWYMVQQPAMSHAPSTFCAALVLWLWDRWQAKSDVWRAAVLGLALGVAMCVRWQNGVLLLLPALDLLKQVRGHGRATLARAAALGVGTLLGASPQLLAWKALYGEFLLRYPPHGADFLRLDHPFLLETFFSSRHGLLSWTPALWLGYLGFLPLFARRRPLALALFAPLLVMSYVNACSGDWWAGGSFSNRRFDSLLPIFAFGIAAAIDALRRFAAAHTHAALFGCALPFVAWNLALAEQTRRDWIPRDDTVAFKQLAGNAAQVVSDRFGFPTTWPASWLFAWRQGLSPGRYDLGVGRYLFYRQNNLNGLIQAGNPEHAALLPAGFGRIEDMQGAPARRIAERARLLAPLDEPEPLELRLGVRALAGPVVASVSVNGSEIGRVDVLPDDWQEPRLVAPAALWRRELNDVVIETRGGPLALREVRFVRSERP
jgi:hypothetical protein